MKPVLTLNISAWVVASHDCSLTDQAKPRLVLIESGGNYSKCDLAVKQCLAVVQVARQDWGLEQPVSAASIAEMALPDTFSPRHWPQTYRSEFEKDDAELNV